MTNVLCNKTYMLVMLQAQSISEPGLNDENGIVFGLVEMQECCNMC